MLSTGHVELVFVCTIHTDKPSKDGIIRLTKNQCRGFKQ